MRYSRARYFLAAACLAFGIIVVMLHNARPAILWQGLSAAALGLTLAYVTSRLFNGDDA
jgi:hypothetical protein